MKGGEVMRFVWSKIEGSRLVPYVVLEMNDEVAEEMEIKVRYEDRWMFIADRLHERYPTIFPPYFDAYGRRHIFWYNNILENFNETYERLVDEKKKMLREYYDDEEGLLEEAKIRVEEELNNLLVVEL